MRRRIMLLLSLLLLLLPAVSTGREDGHPARFLVRSWKSEDGLPGNVARSLGQTPDGLLWVATAEGISRFDGIEFETIPLTGEWRARSLDFFRIFVPSDGSVWVSTTRNGLFQLGNDGFDCVIADVGSEGTGTGRVTRLFCHDRSTYFVRNGGVWRLDSKGIVAIPEPDAGLEQALAEDREDQHRRGREDSSQPPTALIDRNHGIWSIGEGVLNYRATDSPAAATPVRTFNDPEAILDFLEDREGNVWVASPVHGLIRIRPRRVVPLMTDEGAHESSILTGIQTRDGTWWLASRAGGVDRIRDGTMTRHKLLTNGIMRPVSCIFEDRSGRLWFASRDASVFEWDERLQDFEARFTREPALSKIRTIAEDDTGRLWFGGRSKLLRWNGREDADGNGIEDFSAHPLVAGAEITSLAFDSRGTLYGGTAKGRVLRFDGSEFDLLGDFAGHPRNRVSSIVPLEPDELWVATTGAGLFVQTAGRWHRFGKEQGIPDERLTALVPGAGDRDELWLGSLGGILKASRSGLLRSVVTDAPPPAWLRLDHSDGMPTSECVGGGQPGGFRDAAGTLWFPTAAGLTGVNPADVAINTTPPLVHFRPVEINGKRHPLSDTPLVAGPGRVRLVFRFTGVSLSAPEKVTYRVRLAGLDEGPRHIGSLRQEEYQLVPPGHYTFEVTAINGDGVPTPEPATLSIDVRPYFWQTAWFATTATIGTLLLAVSIGGFIARRRLNRRLAELRLHSLLEDERARISRDLHDDLGASLTQVSLLSALAVERNRDDKLHPYLDNLSLKSKQVVGTLDEIVWATNPSHDTLFSLVEYLSLFAQEFLKLVDVRLETDIVREIPSLVIGPRPRHHLLLAAREAINNAVKHGHAETLFLRVAIEDHRLVVSIRDDGKGFPVDAARSGEGLKNLKRRMTDIGGDCRIESVPGGGTAVILCLPLPQPPPH